MATSATFRKIDRTSGTVYQGDKRIGKIERPFEEAGRRTNRRTYKLIMAGRGAGTFRTLDQAITACRAWTAQDATDHKILGS